MNFQRSATMAELKVGPGRLAGPWRRAFAKCLLAAALAFSGVEPASFHAQAQTTVLTQTQLAQEFGPFEVRGWGVPRADALTGNAFSLGQVLNTPEIAAGSAADFGNVLRVQVSAVAEDPNALPGDPGPVEFETELAGRERVVVEASNAFAAQRFLDTVQTVGLACGEFHTLLLKRDGTVRAAGWNPVGQTTVPEGLRGVIAVACGVNHSLAVLANGRAVAWGRNDQEQTLVPEDRNHGFIAAAGGLHHSLLLRRNGTVETLNFRLSPEMILGEPVTNAVAVAAGAFHSLALTGAGEVIAWGVNNPLVTRVPRAATNVVAVAAGGFFSLALRQDGHVVAWGDNTEGQLEVPREATNVVAIAAGSFHALALRRDGRVVAWGDNSQGQADVPDDATNVLAIAAGGYHSQVLRQTLPLLTRVRVDQGRLSAALNLPAGRAYALLVSEDLRHWRTLRREVAQPGSLELSLPTVVADSGFFRALPLPGLLSEAPPGELNFLNLSRPAP